jgi:hypothetical protein
MRRLMLALQTAYADLQDKLQDAEFQSHAREAGNFVPKTIKGRVYWYHHELWRMVARRRVMSAPIPRSCKHVPRASSTPLQRNARVATSCAR